MKINGEKEVKRWKINIYLWQVFNFICINSDVFPEEINKLIIPLLRIEVLTESMHSANSMKNALIFLHNLISKELKQEKSSVKIGEIMFIVLQHFFKGEKK